jgi:hypothetical protein
MTHFLYIFIIIAALITSLHGMETSPDICITINEPRNNEKARIAEWVHNVRQFSSDIKKISGYVSINQLNEYTIGVVESHSPDSALSTLHVYDMKHDKWYARPRINRNERALSELGFNIESMKTKHQVQMVALLETLKIWPNRVQPVCMKNGNLIFVNNDDRIIVINPEKIAISSAFNLPSFIPEYKEIQLFPTSGNRVILSTNSIRNGQVHSFSSDGTHQFSEPIDDSAGKPCNVIEGNNNTIAIGRPDDTRIYANDGSNNQLKLLHKKNGALIDMYDNKLFTFRNNRLKAVSLKTGGTSKIATSWALSLQNGFFCTEGSEENSFFIATPHLQAIQHFQCDPPSSFMPHYHGEHAITCGCRVSDKIPLLHTDIKKTALSDNTGRMLFTVHDGLFMFLKPEPLKLEDNPLTVEEFDFLTQQDTDVYKLFCTIKNTEELPQYSLKFEDLYTYFCIPERLRQNRIKNLAMDSPAQIHTLTQITEEEHNFLKKSYYVYEQYSPHDLFRIILSRPNGYSWDPSLTCYKYLPTNYHKIPQRFKDTIEASYYKSGCVLL